MIIKRGIPIFLAVLFGILTLLGLFVPLPELNDILLNWAIFLAAIALLLGVINLFVVHSRRLFQQQNLYSGVLILTMTAVFVLALLDSSLLNITNNGVNTAFEWLLVPLEAALASLMAFFLLFAGFHLMQRRRNGWSVLFIVSAVLVLLLNVLHTLPLLPTALQEIVGQSQRVLQELFVTAGMRGIVLGIALGTILLSVRLLIGMERPYNK